MKKSWEQILLVAVVLTATVMETGCASTQPFKPTPGGVTYKHDKDLQKVWLASGFDFNGYDALLVDDTKEDLAGPLNAEDAKQLAWAKGELQQQFAGHIGGKNIFKLVTADKSKLEANQKVLTMENTVIEFAKGNGAARFWAGEFGAGQPLIRVQGKMTDGTNLFFVFESYRCGDSAAARLDIGFTPEQNLQIMDLNDLGGDMADFIQQTSQHIPRK